MFRTISFAAAQEAWDNMLPPEDDDRYDVLYDKALDELVDGFVADPKSLRKFIADKHHDLICDQVDDICARRHD